jgi:hypothetical protein
MFSGIQTDDGPMNLGWDTGANYSFVKKSLASARRPGLNEVFYTTRRFELDQFDAGPMRLVAVDLAGLPALDGLNSLVASRRGQIEAKHGSEQHVRAIFDVGGAREFLGRMAYAADARYENHPDWT